MPALHAIHKDDPVKEIMKRVGTQLKDVKLFGNSILCAIYERPRVAKFGTLELQLADTTRKEDEFQGKVGLVLKLGPLAYKDDEHVQFHGQIVKAGDWIVFRPSEGWQITLTHNQVKCRILTEGGIRMQIARPDAVW